MIRTAQDMKSYQQQLREALGDSFLRSTLDKFNVAYREARPRVYEGIDFDGLRDQIAEGKDAALPHLLELFGTFKSNAEAAGAKVHVARNAEEANEIIADIAEKNSVRKIIKAKSMTAEETFLNHHLEKKGLQVTETDLGEWIIQLRKEGPSHMVMPAIHLSRYQVGDLFEHGPGHHILCDLDQGGHRMHGLPLGSERIPHRVPGQRPPGTCQRPCVLRSPPVYPLRCVCECVSHLQQGGGT